MPTHFTAKLIKNPNMTLREFAFACTRAFIVRLKESSDDYDVENAHFNPDDHYVQNELEARIELKRLQSLNSLEWDLEKEKHNAEERLRTLRRMIEADKHQRLFQGMKDQVEEWDAPESCWVIKAFMLDQLRISGELTPSDWKPKLYDSTEDYKVHVLSELAEEIERCEIHIKEEQERTDELNKWLDELRGSL